MNINELIFLPVLIKKRNNNKESVNLVSGILDIPDLNSRIAFFIMNRLPQ